MMGEVADWGRRILGIMLSVPDKSWRAKDLARELRIPTGGYRSFRNLLRELCAAGVLVRQGRRYRKTLEGVESRRGDGAPLHPGQISGRALLRGQSPSVVRDRSPPPIVGVFRREGKRSWVEPLFGRPIPPANIPPGREGKARSGEVVVVGKWWASRSGRAPLGEVTKILGPAVAPGVDSEALLAAFGLSTEFPVEVEAEAARIAESWERGQGGWEGREDLRELRVYAIDPADAWDRDDALSITPLGGDRWEVGIHIADVASFVPWGSVLDREARRRSTSVYLTDRAVPMLPGVLSSGLCSFVTGEERPAFSLLVTLDGRGSLLRHRFALSRVRVAECLTYEQVQEALDGSSALGAETANELRRLWRLARALGTRRRARGSLDFVVPEARVVLSQDGIVEDLRFAGTLDSQRLVEEFMILANERVAEEAARRRLPIPFRTHPPPPPHRLSVLRRILGELGYSLPPRDVGPEHLQGIVEAVRGSPQEGVVGLLLLRAMERARYEPRNRGHFGLAARAYTHFTSPIRRYPDLWVHRVLRRALFEKRPLPGAWSGGTLEKMTRWASAMEKRASEVEQTSLAQKKAQFLEDRLGDLFTGRVSDVGPFGFRVLVDVLPVEGIVRVPVPLDDGQKRRPRSSFGPGGVETGWMGLGDPVRVRLSRVDRLQGHLEFVVSEGSPWLDV